MEFNEPQDIVTPSSPSTSYIPKSPPTMQVNNNMSTVDAVENALMETLELPANN